MKNNNMKLLLVACAITLGFSTIVLGQDSVALSLAPSALQGLENGGIAEGQQLKIEGIVVNRNDESFTVRDSKGTETVVVVNDKTKVKIERRGLFHRDRAATANEILRGLRLKIEGRGDSDGQLIARNITFDEQDLKTAEALESRVEPVENLANSTRALAENNQTRIGEAEQNAQRLSGQIDELGTVANASLSAAKSAQATADQAESDATTANERIGALDDYNVLSKTTVHFKSGSARLSARAKEEIDEIADSIGKDLKGWIVAVEGYADSTGRTARNRSLSERRAKAVIDYLVTKHGLPPRRVVQPFGYGSLDAAAANNTRQGRALNRRAEIAVLVNKGISQTQQTASKEQ
jgi:OOP family OmpA-OmpF porin